MPGAVGVPKWLRKTEIHFSSRFPGLRARIGVAYALQGSHGSTPLRVVQRHVVSASLSRPHLVDAPSVAPTSRADDAALVADVIAGDRAAEEALYRRHAPSVLRLATRLLRSHEDALDVLQDAFVSAFEDIEKLREPSAFAAWTHRIAVRLVHRRFRRRRLLGMLGLDRRNDEVPLESLADDSASPEARVELRWLDAALTRVDDRDRVAWMLRFVEGLPLEEVAVVCDCSLATAKRRIAAADAVARRHLEGGAS